MNAFLPVGRPPARSEGRSRSLAAAAVGQKYKRGVMKASCKARHSGLMPARARARGREGQGWGAGTLERASGTEYGAVRGEEGLR